MTTTPTETRTIDQALAKFTLVDGKGDGQTTACVMTAIAWAAGEAHTDHPVCANRNLADMAIRANDAPGVTPTQRADLLRAGATGLMDTWWIPGEVIAWCMTRADKDATAFDRCMTALDAVSGWKANKVRPDLRSADLRSADLRSADLRSANLRYANLSSANLRYANLSSADLSSANLSYANLSSANLRSANLRYANLSSALGLSEAFGLDTARGNRFTVLPAGWKVDEDTGLIVTVTEVKG